MSLPMLPDNIMDMEKRRKVSFGQNTYKEQELNTIYMDHCYSRPHNHLQESKFLRPTKTLFIAQKSTRKSTNPLAPHLEVDPIIDIEGLPPDQPIIYDTTKAKYIMEECDRHASFARLKEEEVLNWEDKISRINWLPVQMRVFNDMLGILNADHLARLASIGVYNEAIVRRNTIHRSVGRFRQLMSTISWDAKLTQWLHVLMIEHLPSKYLGIYLDILQTLKSKLPTFVDKLLSSTPSNHRVGITSKESLYSLLKRPWDPVAPSLNQDKPKKLPGNPIIIVIPPAPVATTTDNFKRLQKWISLFSNLATVVTVYTNISVNAHRMSMMNCLDQMLATTRAKIQEVKEDYPGRSIILAGFNAGASLALQVAHVESILCVLCLGFSLLTAEGKRGDPDDNLLELQCPVLFVIGQCSNTSLQEDMEDLRERMRVETGLIVVGAADDYLRVNKKKKKAEGITQSVVDRCIVDEVGEFVSGLLLSPYPPQIRLSPSHIVDTNKSPNTERKRNNSNASSIDSEPSSPTMRIIRPVGRPPGTKSKMRPKWNMQMSQGLAMQHSHRSVPPPIKQPVPEIREMPKYITSKKQLLSNKLPKPSKKLPYMTQPSNLTLATNLTSQDILDLPIIFADDNQMLTNNVIQPNDIPTSNYAPLPQGKTSNPNSGKIVFINKQVPVQGPPSSYPSTTIKRPSAPLPVRTNANSVKYAKIILSKRASADDAKNSIVGSLPSDISIKKIESQPHAHDIESQLVATSLPNPKFKSEDLAHDLEAFSSINEALMSDFSRKRQLDLGEENFLPNKIFKSDSL